MATETLMTHPCISTVDTQVDRQDTSIQCSNSNIVVGIENEPIYNSGILMPIYSEYMILSICRRSSS